MKVHLKISNKKKNKLSDPKLLWQETVSKLIPAIESRLSNYSQQYSEVDVKEIVNNLLLRSWLKHKDWVYLPEKAQRAYLWSMANFLKRESYRKTHDRLNFEINFGKFNADDFWIEPSSAQPDELSPALSKIREVLSAHLSERDKELIDLKYQGCYSSSEIAKITGINEAAVRQRLSRARKRAAKFLENLAPEALKKLVGESENND